MTDPIPLLLTILHFGTASLVTVHALLRKRNVSSAIGWIGLAWLSPLLGPVLYFCFGVNRVQRRAQKLKRSRPAPARDGGGEAVAKGPIGDLAEAVGRITGASVEAGSVVAVLESGDEAYPVMLAAIEEARTSIALSTYIFRADAVGQSFIDALARAHRRGVAVRVLIDGFGGGIIRSRAHDLLRREGVPAARHLHSLLPWKMPLLNLRLHKKVLLVDGMRAFVGGMNIGAENVLAGRPGWPVRDVHFELRGPVLRQVMDGFRDDWAFASGEVLDGESWEYADRQEDGAPARVIQSGPDQQPDRLSLVLLCAINAASSSVRIVTPYFLPDEQIVTALQLAVARGVEVDIVVPAIGDHRVMNWAMEGHIRPLLNAGCRIWRSPPPFDHSKLATVDESWCLIGSANWDARSLRLNFEMTVEFYERDLVRRLNALVDGKRGELVTLGEIDGRWPVIKIRDAAARLLMPYL